MIVLSSQMQKQIFDILSAHPVGRLGPPEQAMTQKFMAEVCLLVDCEILLSKATVPVTPAVSEQGKG